MCSDCYSKLYFIFWAWSDYSYHCPPQKQQHTKNQSRLKLQKFYYLLVDSSLLYWIRQNLTFWSQFYQLFLVKVCSLWSCAFLAFCSSERTWARESTFFILQRNSSFLVINSLHQRLIFPLMCFTEITWTSDAEKKNAHDQNEWTIKTVFHLTNSAK